MKAKTKRAILFILGFAVSVIPAALAILSYFPIWIERGNGALFSGLTFLLLLIASVPLWKAIKRILSSPSAPILWFILFIAFYSLSKIADEMTVISFIGFVSNLIGALLFKLSRKCGGNIQ